LENKINIKRKLKEVRRLKCIVYWCPGFPFSLSYY